MCGRYVTPRTAGLVELFDLDVLADDLAEPTWNARPSFGPKDAQPPVPVVIHSAKDGQRRLAAAHWPYIPRWTKRDDFPRNTFNARSEGITGKNTWKSAVATQRAIFPALGYFETQGSGANRKRFYFHPAGDEVLALGGIYSWWRADDDPWLLTAAIMTIAAPDGEVAEIHDRAPLVLPPDTWNEWLDPDVHADQGLIDALGETARLEVSSLDFHEVAWLDEDSPRMTEPVDSSPPLPRLERSGRIAEV